VAEIGGSVWDNAGRQRLWILNTPAVIGRGRREDGVTVLFWGEEGTGRLGGGQDTAAHGTGGSGGFGRLELQEE
jgi:hypothetical protein